MGLAERLNSVSPPSARNIPTPSGKRSSIARDEYAMLKHDVHEQLLQALGQQAYAGQMEQRVLEENVFNAIQSVLAKSKKPLSTVDRARISQEIIDDILGNGPLEPLLRDPEITEIMVNRADSIFIERGGKLHATDLRFSDEDHLRRTIDRIVSRVGRRVDEASPMVDARLPDGSRVNAVLPPIALDGCSLTIRKFSKDPFTAKDLVTMGTLSRAATDVIDAFVRGRLNILISGGTGSGKTTTLNVMSGFIPDDERIVTVEDAAELQLSQPHVLRMESRPANVEGHGQVTIRDLVRNSLRMRPDRIIVGEVRDAAALDMLQAMNTGHDGSLSTVHANTPRDALSRIETMVLMAGMDLPVRVIREQIASAINVVVQQARMRDGSRHVTQISEITGLEGDTILMQDLFVFDYNAEDRGQTMGKLVPTGITPSCLDALADNGVILSTDHFRSPWSR
jgi:pilus assembly protein CpaF